MKKQNKNTERVVARIITLYPAQIEKVNRFMLARNIRKFSPAIQRLIDEVLEPNGAQPLEEHGKTVVAVRP